MAGKQVGEQALPALTLPDLAQTLGLTLRMGVGLTVNSRVSVRDTVGLAQKLGQQQRQRQGKGKHRA